MSTAEYLLFVAGGLRLATSVAGVAAVHDQLEVKAVGGTVDWFLGIAVSDGALLPVTDLGGLLNDKPSGGEYLQVEKSIGIAALRVDQVLGIKPTRVLNEIERSAYSSAASEWLSQHPVEFGGAEYSVIDIAALMQSERFSSIEEAIA